MPCGEARVDLTGSPVGTKTGRRVDRQSRSEQVHLFEYVPDQRTPSISA